MLRSLRANRYYRPLLWATFALCMLLATLRGSMAVMEPDWFAADDFVEYWAAGRLNLQAGDPYDPVQLLRLQNQAGRSGDEAVMMWNPPWTLALVMPFGVLSYPVSRTLWMMLSMAVIIFSMDLLWGLYGGNPKLRWISWLLGFSFIPVLDALKKGQSGILILLGIVGFLFFVEKKRPWLAGISLALLAVKPHVAYLFLLAALLWSLRQRAWAVIGGMAGALCAATLLASAANPQVIGQYLHAVSTYPPSGWATPTLGGILRLAFGPERFWLQFLPSALGLIWLLVYWARHRASWHWLEQAPLVILVSLATTAYGWSFDQPAALVAIVQVFVVLTLSRWSVASTVIVLSYVGINLLDLAAPGNEIFLFWLAPSVLFWYVASWWALNRYSSPKQNLESDIAGSF